MKFSGIIGGVGPYAGLQLVKCIFDNTLAETDQEHIPLCLLNLPMIPDRSQYLMNPSVEPHPKTAILNGVAQLEQIEATHFAIPCNTAHAPDIIDPVIAEMDRRGYAINFIHLIHETMVYIANKYPEVHKVGLLSTAGTYLSGVYPLTAEKIDSKQLPMPSIILPPTQEERLEVHDAVYNPVFGIKAKSSPIDPRAVDILKKHAERLIKQQGADAIILGCTEISLADTLLSLPVPTIDPLQVVARALIQATYPERLKKL